MKENTERIAIKVCYVLWAICALGLVLAVLGLLFQWDPLCYAGLLLAAPLFLIVLPICLFLVSLQIVFAPAVLVWQVITWWRRPTNKDKQTDNPPAQPTHSA